MTARGRNVEEGLAINDVSKEKIPIIFVNGKDSPKILSLEGLE